jgi:hypothetical protein
MADGVIVNTLEQPGEFDALVKLRPGEPYFLLIGRDRSAPALVLEWARRHRNKVLAESDAGKLDDATLRLELRQATDAEGIAWAMQDYKTGNPSVAPLPAPERPTAYTGFELDPATEARDRQHAELARAASRINNAVADLTEAAEAAEKHGHGGAAMDLFALAERAKLCSERITPKRPLPAVAA